jgi:hypothetical protein
LRDAAISLLTTHDKLTRELAETKRALRMACIAYGREQGYFGYSPDNLRAEVNHEGENNAINKQNT